MRSKELQTSRKWVSDKQYCDWTPTRELDNGQKTSFYPKEFEDKDILLTDKDIHFHPSQKQLEEFTYYAPTELYNKLFKPLFYKHQMKKDKVLGYELRLFELKG